MARDISQVFPYVPVQEIWWPFQVPLILAVTGATVVARLLGAPSIYSARLDEAPGEDSVGGPPQAVEELLRLR